MTEREAILEAMKTPPPGGYFVWDQSIGGPLLLVAGGSGVVPLMAMLRHRAAAGIKNPARLLYSARSYEQIIYADELEALCRIERAR